MNVQPMTLDLNALRGPQQPSNKPVSGKQEDNFSSVLEKSREKQETPSKPKVNNGKDHVTQGSKDKVVTDPKEAAGKENTKEVTKAEETVPEDQLAALEESEQVIQAIADLLNITVEDLEKMLASLQIGISDLLKGDNLQQLIMQVHGVEEPMDLLLIPEVISEIKAITSVVEEYTANMDVAPEVELLKPELKSAGTEEAVALSGQETVLKPETQVAAGTNQSTTNQAPETTADNTAVEAKGESVATINIAEPSNESSSQGEEQAAPNQNNAANQFLDQLTQSMGEAFQTQNQPVTEAFETVAARSEVVNPRMVLDQIVERIKVTSLENEAQMTIQLKPEHLGKLNMEVISKQGIMTAHITVENEKTKELLEQNIQSLKESLEDKGLAVQELEVAVGQNQNEDRPGYEGKKSNRNVSDIINDIMNEEALEETLDEVKADNMFDTDTNEVDFIA